MTASSAASLDWDTESTPTATSDVTPASLRLRQEGAVLASLLDAESTEALATRASQSREEARTATLVTPSRRLAAKHATAKPLAEWQGHVRKVEGDRLHAAMEGVFGQGIEGETYDAVIPMTEVAPDDLPLVREGAYFRLSIAYAMSHLVGGTFTRTSTLVFRRLPAYQAADLERAREIARELLAGIRLE